MTGLVARLISAGTPPELVEEVAMLVARAQIDREAIETRRSRDRDRQASRRHVMSRDVTLDTVTPCDNAEIPPLDKSPQTPKINPPVHTQGGAPARGWPCPEGVQPQHWRDFLDNRRRKRLGTSETARLGQMRSLADLADDDWPPGRLVQHAAEKGWGSINDPRESNGHGQRPANDHRKPHRRADEIDDAADFLGLGGRYMAAGVGPQGL